MTLTFIAGSLLAFLAGLAVERIFLYRTDFERKADELKLKNLIQQALTIEFEQKKAQVEAEMAKAKQDKTKDWIYISLRFYSKSAAVKAWNKFELFFANNRHRYEQSNDSKSYNDDDVYYVFEKYRIIDPECLEKQIDFNAVLGDVGDAQI